VPGPRKVDCQSVSLEGGLSGVDIELTDALNEPLRPCFSNKRMRFSNSGRVRAMSASALRSIASGRLASTNCQSQGSARGKYLQPTTWGPMSSVSHFGSWRSTPEHRQRDASPGARRAGIAKGAALAWRDSVAHRYLEAGALQVIRRAHADDAGAGDNDAPSFVASLASLHGAGRTRPLG
jgi:hypothetical protein